jgi:hypothetical protein
VEPRETLVVRRELDVGGERVEGGFVQLVLASQPRTQCRGELRELGAAGRDPLVREDEGRQVGVGESKAGPTTGLRPRRPQLRPARVPEHKAGVDRRTGGAEGTLAGELRIERAVEVVDRGQIRDVARVPASVSPRRRTLMWAVT